MIKHVSAVFALFYLLCSSQQMKAQAYYTFNAPGNTCYFDYAVFAPDLVMAYDKKPLLFIVGQVGQNPLEIFEDDSLKNDVKYFNSILVYVPADEEHADQRLKCLISLRTTIAGQRRGSYNTFVKCYDSRITENDLKMHSMSFWFSNVSLYNQNTEKFEIEEMIDPDDQETYMGGTYYIEEDENKPKSNGVQVFQNYFGASTRTNVSVSGMVRDKGSKETLPAAYLSIRGTKSGGVTNADGYFVLHHVPCDTSVLVVKFVGYDAMEYHLSPAAIRQNIVIELSPSEYNLKAVTVEATKEDVKFASADQISAIRMTPRKLQTLPNLGEKDVMRSFQLMPGISAANESSSGLYVRGGTPDQNLVLYDGFTIYHVDHLYGFFSAFNSNALKDVMVYKGGYESKYGGRLSSVTELTAKEGSQKRFNVGGDLSLLSMNAFVEAPLGKKVTSIVAFRKSYKGFLYDKIFEKFNPSSSTDQPVMRGPGGMQSTQDEATSYFYDLNGKVTFRPNSKDLLSLSFFNGTDKLDNSQDISAPSFGGGGGGGFSSSTTDLTKYGNIGSSARWSRKWNDKWYSNTLLSYSRYYSDRDRSQERTMTDADGNETTVNNGIFENNDLRDYSAKSDWTYYWRPKVTVETGVYTSYYDIDYTYAQNDTSTVLEKHNKALLSGAFAQARIKLAKDKLSIVPGIRSSHFTSTNKVYTEPRLSATYAFTDKISLKTATGLYYQMVNRVTREDILSGSRDFWLLSDGKNVPVGQSIHYIAGLSYENNKYLFSVEGYYKQLSNLTEYSLRFSNRPTGTSVNENFYSGSGYARGVEFLLQKKTGAFNGWVSYTLAEAKNKFAVYSADYYPANQDVTHEFKVVGTYQYKRWDFSATWIYATGRPYTAPSGAYYLTLLDGNTQDFFTVTTKNGLRLPDYHRADVSANYKILAGMKGDRKRREIGSVGLSIFNVYNRTNIWYKTYTIQDGDILETDVTYVGITPNITLSLKIR